MNAWMRTGGAAMALMLGTALPALAQAGLCGGVGDNGQWLGGDEVASDISATVDHLEQMALTLMNTEYVGLFTVSQAGEYRIEAQQRGFGDPVIDLRDAGGMIVASDDDSGGNAAARAETWLEPGSYCLSMRSYDGSPMTAQVRVGRMEHATLTEGFATSLPPQESGYIWPAYCDAALVRSYMSDGPVDDLLAQGITVSASPVEMPFWGFTLAAPASVSITASNPTADPIIALYDSFGNWLAENDDWEGLDSRIDVTWQLEPGDYCISVGAYSDARLPIEVSLSSYDPAGAMAGMYDRGEVAPPLDGSYPVTLLGGISGRLRQDVMTSSVTTWFAFDVSEAGLVVIEAVANNMGDPVMILFDDLGRQVAFNDDANNSLDSMIAARVMPGTYTLGVWQYGSSSAQVPTRMLFERYVTAD